jgi:hypothetical protein
MMVTAARHVLPGVDHWQPRRKYLWLLALTGPIGVVAIALCGFETGGYWVACLAERLGSNQQRYTSVSSPTADGGSQFQDRQPITRQRVWGG